MTFGDIRNLTNNLLNADEIEVELNTICNKETGEWTSSQICEIHYDKNKNKIFITPEVISI